MSSEGLARYRREPAGTGVTYQFHSGGQELMEATGSYGSQTTERRYVRLPGSVDEVILMIDNTLSGTCTTTSYAACEVWAHGDRLGSTVKTTNSAGAEIDEYTYSPYGESGPEGDSGFPFRFTGQKLDPTTGLYYYKARWYDPETGRFLQTDPIGYGDGMNMYAYVGGDPVNATDPTGLILCTGSHIRVPDKEGCPSRPGSNVFGGAVEQGQSRGNGAGPSECKICNDLEPVDKVAYWALSGQGGPGGLPNYSGGGKIGNFGYDVSFSLKALVSGYTVPLVGSYNRIYSSIEEALRASGIAAGGDEVSVLIYGVSGAYGYTNGWSEGSTTDGALPPLYWADGGVRASLHPHDLYESRGTGRLGHPRFRAYSPGDQERAYERWPNYVIDRGGLLWRITPEGLVRAFR